MMRHLKTEGSKETNDMKRGKGSPGRGNHHPCGDSEVGTVGETLTETTRHHDNHLHSLFYDRRSW